MVSVEFLTKLKLNSETNLICIPLTSQCDQYVAKVIKKKKRSSSEYAQIFNTHVKWDIFHASINMDGRGGGH